ncbi:MAG: hypothetical protein LBV16_01160 [Elusimicrobiota bacterium]|jgi:hypothetical protein|nr:hypothetical protein [Elusimicrobiota bacterium]
MQKTNRKCRANDKNKRRTLDKKQNNKQPNNRPLAQPTHKNRGIVCAKPQNPFYAVIQAFFSEKEVYYMDSAASRTSLFSHR